METRTTWQLSHQIASDILIKQYLVKCIYQETIWGMVYDIYNIISQKVYDIYVFSDISEKNRKFIVGDIVEYKSFTYVGVNNIRVIHKLTNYRIHTYSVTNNVVPCTFTYENYKYPSTIDIIKWGIMYEEKYKEIMGSINK